MSTAAQTYRAASRDHRRDKRIVDHLDFVRHILGRVIGNLPTGVDVENLESAGMLGLVEASQQFDEMRGVPFKTFAYPRIRGAIIDELRRNCPLPQQMLQSIAKVRKACEALEPPISPEEIARHARLTTAQVEECLEAMRLARPNVWDESTYGNQATTRDKVSGPEAIVERRESEEVLADCIEQLPDQERLVLTLYYLEDLRLKEIGRVLNLSESRVSRILAKAEFRLRQYVKVRNR